MACQKYHFCFGLQDSNYIEMKPSIMGCSVVYACRHVFGLGPVWPPRLRDLVGLDEADLIDCAFVLIDTHQRALSGQMGVEGGCGVIGHRRPLPPSFKRKPTAKPAASTPPVAKQSRKKAKVTAIVEVVDDEEEVEIKRFVSENINSSTLEYLFRILNIYFDEPVRPVAS